MIEIEIFLSFDVYICHDDTRTHWYCAIRHNNLIVQTWHFDSLSALYFPLAGFDFSRIFFFHFFFFLYFPAQKAAHVYSPWAAREMHVFLFSPMTCICRYTQQRGHCKSVPLAVPEVHCADLTVPRPELDSVLMLSSSAIKIPPSRPSLFALSSLVLLHLSPGVLWLLCFL